MSPKRTLANSGTRVVVTGMGCVSPLGLDVGSTWSQIIEGRSGASTISLFDASGIDVKFACEVKSFDPDQYLNKKDSRRMDRFIQLGIAAAFQSIEQSKIHNQGSVDWHRVGTIIASGIGGLGLIEEQHKIAIEKPDRVSPFFIPGTISNMIAGQVSIMKGFKGPSYCTVSACSSSAHAIGEAARQIERGDCDIVVAGGAESTVTLCGIKGFANMKALSTRNEAPEKASRPFDKDRDGFVMGEGAAVLVLESLESAEKRGVEILGELVGYAANSDAYHMTNPSENGQGAAICIVKALEDAGLKPEQINHVNMHGTSTPAGDIAETMAIKSVFGAQASKLSLTSTKSMTGHLLGAAGAIEAVFSILALKNQISPPTINLENPDPACDLNYTPLRMQKVPMKYALSNSFGFGGTNASLLFKGLHS
jgi:3-oxoacyl-[acyl-carrier-protein] synthase II